MQHATTSDVATFSRPSRWHVCVRPRTPLLDGHGRGVLSEMRQIGFEDIEHVASSKIYFLEGSLDRAGVLLIAGQLLADPVAETFDCMEGFSHRRVTQPAIEVHTLPGVMNPVALSALESCNRVLGASDSTSARIDQVDTARRYEFTGVSSVAELEQIASRVLANACMERWYIQGLGRSDQIPDGFARATQQALKIKHVAVRALNDEALATLSRRAHLFLSLEEMRTIRDHFATLGRDPTDLELEALAQTWSEHCVHKTLKSSVDYRGDDFGRPGQVEVRFKNLLADTIVKATETLNRDWCLSVFVDNAGVIAFDEKYGIAFKAETHNHPSAIEPYGGAATGVGGCIRDIMGCGLGAKPIASTDVFCLAPPDFDPSRLPQDVLHPRRVLRGVVRGVRDYGNRMGIPTVNGAIHFDERYLANPLVFCGCVGLIPRDRIEKAPRVGDRIVVAGGRTGRDGIHGATFSSAELADTHAQEFSHAVQIGNAIEEKKLLDAMLLARDHPGGCLYSAVTDCGAGGLSSAVGEMGEMLGAEVDLEHVPLKYAGLRYDEIWISEAQERMVFAVAPDRLSEFLSVFHGEEVEATVIGRFTGDGVLHVRFDGKTVGKLGMDFLHDGLPRSSRKATWTATARSKREPASDNAAIDNDRLLRELGRLDVASKEWVIRQYDHEVQGRSVVKPLVGPGFGPSDAAVLRPRYNSQRGIALACGLCPELAEIDPYWMAIVAIDEALRNVICVGANPRRTAILDNFCWPKVETEESLGALVRTCRGAHDAAVAFGLPFISGKDSLNNEYSMSKEEASRVRLPEQMAIPYTLLISALGIVDDVRRCVSMDLKDAGNVLVVASAPVDQVGLSAAMALHHCVADLIGEGKVRSAHDVSDGGLAVAVAEMCIAGALGARVTLDLERFPFSYTGSIAPRDTSNGEKPRGLNPAARNKEKGNAPAGFGESVFAPLATSYVLEMVDADARATGWPIIGRIESEPRLIMQVENSGQVDLAVDELAAAWRAPLANGGA